MTIKREAVCERNYCLPSPSIIPDGPPPAHRSTERVSNFI
jgi:hypothetical protein